MDPSIKAMSIVFTCKLRNSRLRQLHDAKCSGHSGQDQNFERQRRHDIWVGQHREVVEWVRKCPNVLKGEIHKTRKLLHNIPQCLMHRSNTNVSLSPCEAAQIR